MVGALMDEFLAIFLALLFEALPFLLIGVLLAVAAGPIVERILRSDALAHPTAGLVAGAGAGFALPVCDCGARPLAHRLASAGRREFAMAFLVAAPVVNPIVLVTTWLAFRDVDLVVMRFGLTFIMAVLAGFVLAHLRSDLVLPLAGERGMENEGPGSLAGRVLTEFFELFPFLVVGSALAAGAQVFLDQGALTSTEGIYLSVVAMMALAFLLSICSSVDAFVAAGLGSSLGTGPALAFLTFGPIVNLKSMPMYLRLFTIPTIAIIVLITLQFAFVGSTVVQLRGW